MATRSTIWITNEDGSRDGIYCHNDGYPDGVGSILAKFYNTEEKIRELIDLGDISYLGPTLDNEDTKSYHRWRNDPIKIYHLPKQQDIRSFLQQYNYNWKDGSWWMAKEDGKWLPLDQIIMETKKEKNFYPAINEIYDPNLNFMNADDSCPPILKKQFRSYARMIYVELSDDNFTHIEIEDYLKHLIDEVLDRV